MPAKKTSRKAPVNPAAADRSASLLAEDLEKIRPHVINLRAGKFIDSGDFATSAADVDAIFSKHLPASKKKKVLIWAHGGLVPEDGALQHVVDHRAGWLEADIYPIYFVWETGIWTSLRDVIKGAPQGERGLGDFLADRSDALLENLLHYPAVKVWSQIKDYARLACEKDGGALYMAKKLAAFAAAHPDVEFYACGHSAGSNFHSWFLPAAVELGVSFKELFLLAPAVTVPEFNARLAPRIGAGKGIARTTLFTMNQTAELADNCFKIYRKSLLYFVSRSCEPEQPTPILGLEESLKASPSLRKLFGIGTSSATGETVWSPNRLTAGPAASNSTTHGGFDNDYTTLNSLARRISGKNSISVFEDETGRSFEPEEIATTTRGRRKPRQRAVCIGIDDYAASPLAGCVNDAREWRSALKEKGFETTLLTNGQATRDGIIRAISDLIDGAVPGDVLVFQYAGHGTHVDDVDGDEDDGQDEALVPFDYDDGNFLIDDDIGDLMDRVPAGVNLTCFMDCCHSGTITRIFANKGTKNEGERARFLQVPEPVMRKHVANRKNAPPRGPRAAYRGKPEISFAACRPDQTAKENDGHGYFTLAATRILRSHGGELTHAEFLKLVRADFPLPAASQEPQLDCDEGRDGGILLKASTATPARAAAAADVATALAAGPCSNEARLLIEAMRDAMHVLRKLVG